MKENQPKTTYVTKNQLTTDYVSKKEFHKFKSEIYDFREETTERFNNVDKRLNTIERKIDDFRDEVRIEMGAWRDQLRSDFLVAIEYIKDIAAGKKRTSDPIF